MAGLVPAIHVSIICCEGVDARDIGVRKHAVLRTAMRGHDNEWLSKRHNEYCRQEAGDGPGGCGTLAQELRNGTVDAGRGSSRGAIYCRWALARCACLHLDYPDDIWTGCNRRYAAEDPRTHSAEKFSHSARSNASPLGDASRNRGYRGTVRIRNFICTCQWRAATCARYARRAARLDVQHEPARASRP